MTQDLIGGFPWFRPKFVTPVMESASLLQKSVDAWRSEQSERYRKALVLHQSWHAIEPDTLVFMPSDSLSHIDPEGKAAMVDVSQTPDPA